MKLIIAEKPLMVPPIAKNRKATVEKNGYMEGNGYIVTAAYGHLVELFEPEDYDQKYKTWSLEDLPIIPDFKYKVGSEPYRSKRFYLLKELLFQADEIINACDSDREGENIFWQILNQAGFKDYGKCKRLWFSDFTNEELDKSFNKLIPLTEMKNFYKSAETRQKADWLYGMNLSRLLTKSAPSGSWNFGRVQTPTLMLICDAFKKHSEFVETPFWEVQVKLQKNSIPFFAVNSKSFTQKTDAEALYKSVPGTLTCTKAEVNDKTENAPKLFSLSALQQDASREFGLKMDKTLEAAQSLYEKHKLTTYPRTDSRYLPTGMKDQVKQVMALLQNSEPVPTPLRDGASIVARGTLSDKPFDDKKVSSHFAIIPTTEPLKGKELTKEEKIIYYLVVRQFVRAFLAPCLKKETRLEFAHQSDVFKASGSVILSQGWRVLDDSLNEFKGKETKDEEGEGDEEVKLPEVKQGDTLPVLEKKVLEKKTRKPPLLTTHALSKLMQTAGKLIDNEELAEAMKDCGLGTEATRADAVKRLYEHGYIGDKGKSLVPTKDGWELYKILNGLKIASPELTGIFESKLHKIAGGEMGQPEFMTEATSLMLEHMDILKESGKLLVSHKYDKTELGVKCPKCKDGMILEGEKSYHCANAKWSKSEANGTTTWTNSGCTFSIPITISEKKISITNAKELITNGITKEISGFISKEKKEFTARLKLNEEKKATFVFEKEATVKNGSEVTKVHCPKCKTGTIAITPKVAKCSNDKCDFVIFKTVSKKDLTEKQIITLAEKGQTELIKGFVSNKTGKSFDAILMLDESKAVKFKFPEKK